MKPINRSILSAVCAAVAALVVLCPAASVAADGAPSVVYLVRHAEKAPEAADPADPPLSEAGTRRALALAEVLADVELASIHSTDLRRTRLTAQAAADARDVEIQIYDPFDREATAALVQTLRTTPGGHLVVGHSNTTPEMVEALGGDPGPAIAEDEYDRLYVVSFAEDSAVESKLLRYGEPSP